MTVGVAGRIAMSGNTINVHIRNRSVCCLLDSGASISCITADLLHKLKLPVESLRDGDTKTVFLADGHPIAVQGRAELTVKISGLSIPCAVLILPSMRFDLILGLDFLTASKARIDFDAKMVTFFDELTATRLSTSNAHSDTVCCLHATILKPLSETLVPVLLPSRYKAETSIIEPFAQEAKHKFMCARSAIDSSTRTAVCRVLNPTSQVIWLPKHKPLACVAPIFSEVLEMFSDDQPSPTTSSLSSSQPPSHTPTHCHDTISEDAVRISSAKPDYASSYNLSARESHLADTMPGRPLQSHFDPDEPSIGKSHYSLDNVVGSTRDVSFSDSVNKLTGTVDGRCQSLDELKVKFHSDNLSADENARLKAFLLANVNTFSSSLEDLGRTHLTQHTIHTGSASPIHQRAYRHSVAAKAEIARQTEKLLSAGLIEPSHSLWSSPIVLVQKKSGEFRMCVDYRKLNSVTESISFPLPQLNDVFDALGESKPKYFSLLDLKSGFHQIPLDPATKEKSSFVTHQGQFQHTTAPFGLKNLPSFFQLLMSRVFQNLHFKSLIVYMDDILVYSASFEQHLVHLKEVFDRLNAANLKLNPVKCSFGLDKILYLGHVLSPEGVSVDESKTKVIRDYPRPQSPKEVRAFLGLAGYYRKFIRQFSMIASPLNRLLRKDMKFVWDDLCEESFVKLKQALSSAPVLVFPDMSKPFIINCDASCQAIGFLLAQEDSSGREHPIAFGGRSLSTCERNYSVSELEMLAMISAIKQFHCYVVNTQFTVYTDHISLKYLQSLKASTTGRLLRWSLLLQQYDFDVKYKKGKCNLNVDALSRICYPMNSDMADEDNENIVAPIDNDANQLDLNLVTDSDLAEPVEVDEDASLRDMATEQSKCLECNPIIRYLELGELPKDDREARKLVIESSEFAVNEGVLYHYYQPRSKGSHRSYINQLVVPLSMRQSILNGYHEECSHPGFHRCYLSIRRKYYWKGLHRDLQNHIMSCSLCQQCKYPLPLNKPPMTSLPIKQIFGRWHMDILQLPKSREGFRYILLCVESLTRFPEMILLRDQSAQSIAEALYREIFTRYGPPETLLSDRGANFLSKIVKELSALFGVKRIHTASYNPRCNGACEVVNRSIWKMLRLHCKDERDWPIYIPAILYSLRATTSANLGHSPAFLLFGRDFKFPVDKQMGMSDEPETTSEYVKRISNAMELARQQAADETVVLQARNKKNYDLKTSNPDFVIGDQVWLFNPVVPIGRKPKLFKKFVGPYYVVSKVGLHTYLLRHSLTNKLLRHPVNADRLRHFVDRRDFEPDLPVTPTADVTSTSGLDPDATQVYDAVVPAASGRGQAQVGTGPVAAPSPWVEAEKLTGMKLLNKKRFYRVIFKNKSLKPEWVSADDVSDCLKREFHIKRTLTGRVRKRPTPQRFVTGS